MSSEEGSVAEVIVVPTTVAQRDQHGAFHRPRNGRLRLRRDQWLYELSSDDDGHDDHSSTTDEKKSRTARQQRQQGDEGKGKRNEGLRAKGRPSGGGGGGGGEEGNMFDAFLFCIKGVLAGVQGFWLLQWALGRLSDVLTCVVEFGLLLLGQPSESFG